MCVILQSGLIVSLYRYPFSANSSSRHKARKHSHMWTRRVCLPIINYICLRRIKIADLGISKQIPTTIPYARTRIGTPLYESPELLKYQPYSKPSDIWALGIVIYELCTFRHPFVPNPPDTLESNILYADPPPIPRTPSQSSRIGFFFICYLDS